MSYAVDSLLYQPLTNIEKRVLAMELLVGGAVMLKLKGTSDAKIESTICWLWKLGEEDDDTQTGK